jgi:hypothetical protein
MKIVGVILFVGIVLSGLLLFRGKTNFSSGLPVLPSSTSASLPSQIIVPTISGAPQVISLYNEHIEKASPEQVNINEIRLANDALHLLEKSKWNGKDKTLPIQAKDFDQNALKDYIVNEEAKKGKLTIPAVNEAIFVSPTAAQDIEQVALSAQREYIAYLRSKGVLETYIKELDTRVLPADSSRIVYYPENNPAAPPTATEGLVVNGQKDFSRLQMALYAVDVFNASDTITKSRIIGPLSDSQKRDYQIQARDMAIRYLLYHELTHALQQSYVNLHVTKEKDKLSKTSWINATKTLYSVDPKYFWKWGNVSYAVDSNNRHINDESQAEGVSYEILTNVYSLSSIQQQQLWAFLFDRLSRMRDTTKEIQQVFEKRFPNFLPDTFGTALSSVFGDYPDSNGRYVLVKTAMKFDNIPADVGYLNPMRPEDASKFWFALQNN